MAASHTLFFAFTFLRILSYEKIVQREWMQLLKSVDEVDFVLLIATKGTNFVI